MRKRLIALSAACLVTLMCSAACSENGAQTPDNPDPGDVPAVYVTVTFDSDGGNEIAPVTVKQGETISCPEVVSLRSTLENPLVFDGWYLNDVAWEFENAVNEDMTLVAHWKQDGKYTVPVIPD